MSSLIHLFYFCLFLDVLLQAGRAPPTFVQIAPDGDVTSASPTCPNPRKKVVDNWMIKSHNIFSRNDANTRARAEFDEIHAEAASRPRVLSMHEAQYTFGSWWRKVQAEARSRCRKCRAEDEDEDDASTGTAPLRADISSDLDENVEEINLDGIGEGTGVEGFSDLDESGEASSLLESNASSTDDADAEAEGLPSAGRLLKAVMRAAVPTPALSSCLSITIDLTQIGIPEVKLVLGLRGEVSYDVCTECFTWVIEADIALEWSISLPMIGSAAVGYNVNGQVKLEELPCNEAEESSYCRFLHVFLPQQSRQLESITDRCNSESPFDALTAFFKSLWQSAKAKIQGRKKNYVNKLDREIRTFEDELKKYAPLFADRGQPLNDNSGSRILVAHCRWGKANSRTLADGAIKIDEADPMCQLEVAPAFGANRTTKTNQQNFNDVYAPAWGARFKEPEDFCGYTTGVTVGKLTVCKPDRYLCFKRGTTSCGSSQKLFGEVWRSSYKKNNPHPNWNEGHGFRLPNGAGDEIMVAVTMWDAPTSESFISDNMAPTGSLTRKVTVPKVKPQGDDIGIASQAYLHGPDMELTSMELTSKHLNESLQDKSGSGKVYMCDGETLEFSLTCREKAWWHFEAEYTKDPANCAWDENRLAIKTSVRGEKRVFPKISGHLAKESVPPGRHRVFLGIEGQRGGQNGCCAWFKSLKVITHRSNEAQAPVAPGICRFPQRETFLLKNEKDEPTGQAIIVELEWAERESGRTAVGLLKDPLGAMSSAVEGFSSKLGRYAEQVSHRVKQPARDTKSFEFKEVGIDYDELSGRFMARYKTAAVRAEEWGHGLRRSPADTPKYGCSDPKQLRDRTQQQVANKKCLNEVYCMLSGSTCIPNPIPRMECAHTSKECSSKEKGLCYSQRLDRCIAHQFECHWEYLDSKNKVAPGLTPEQQKKCETAEEEENADALEVNQKIQGGGEKTWTFKSVLQKGLFFASEKARWVKYKEQGYPCCDLAYLADDDRVVDFAHALEMHRKDDEKPLKELGFLAEVATSIANLFIRTVGDVQAIFNIYFTGHPEWDGSCLTVRPKFETLFEHGSPEMAAFGTQQTPSEQFVNYRMTKVPKIYPGDTYPEPYGRRVLQGETKLKSKDNPWCKRPWASESRLQSERQAFAHRDVPTGRSTWFRDRVNERGTTMYPQFWCEALDKYLQQKKLAEEKEESSGHQPPIQAASRNPQVPAGRVNQRPAAGRGQGQAGRGPGPGIPHPPPPPHAHKKPEIDTVKGLQLDFRSSCSQLWYTESETNDEEAKQRAAAETAKRTAQMGGATSATLQRQQSYGSVAGERAPARTMQRTPSMSGPTMQRALSKNSMNGTRAAPSMTRQPSGGMNRQAPGGMSFTPPPRTGSSQQPQRQNSQVHSGGEEQRKKKKEGVFTVWRRYDCESVLLTSHFAYFFPKLVERIQHYHNEIGYRLENLLKCAGRILGSKNDRQFRVFPSTLDHDEEHDEANIAHKCSMSKMLRYYSSAMDGPTLTSNLQWHIVRSSAWVRKMLTSMSAWLRELSWMEETILSDFHDLFGYGETLMGKALQADILAEVEAEFTDREIQIPNRPKGQTKIGWEIRSAKMKEHLVMAAWIKQGQKGTLFPPPVKYETSLSFPLFLPYASTQKRDICRPNIPKVLKLEGKFKSTGRTWVAEEAVEYTTKCWAGQFSPIEGFALDFEGCKKTAKNKKVNVELQPRDKVEIVGFRKLVSGAWVDHPCNEHIGTIMQNLGEGFFKVQIAQFQKRLPAEQEQKCGAVKDRFPHERVPAENLLRQTDDAEWHTEESEAKSSVLSYGFGLRSILQITDLTKKLEEKLVQLMSPKKLFNKQEMHEDGAGQSVAWNLGVKLLKEGGGILTGALTGNGGVAEKMRELGTKVGTMGVELFHTVPNKFIQKIGQKFMDAVRGAMEFLQMHQYKMLDVHVTFTKVDDGDWDPSFSVVYKVVQSMDVMMDIPMIGDIHGSLQASQRYDLSSVFSEIYNGLKDDEEEDIFNKCTRCFARDFARDKLTQQQPLKKFCFKQGAPTMSSCMAENDACSNSQGDIEILDALDCSQVDDARQGF